ncbi:LysM peptidoglycan-binding domain-containing protein [Calditerrivibrio sp.]|uniref:lytic transglycosylase domain-containing protein n=1 Tax=Calditerrivibrio sp. TaxID=2792612 RepID=UPI003D14446E
MKKIVMLLLSISLLGCAGLSKPGSVSNQNTSTKPLETKNFDIQNIKISSPHYIYSPEIRTTATVDLLNTEENNPKVAVSSNKDNKQEKPKQDSVNLSKVYKPDFDISFLFQDNKKLNLHYNTLDNITETFNVPVTINDRVKKYIERFTTTSRNTMQRWINNSFKYLFYVKDLFQSYGLPTDLSYLPLAESGFDPVVRSRAGAVGMWQFMESTGRLYGLKINYWVDERKDFEKSTDAAARHLKDLYEKFNDWSLALAAYNAGAGRIQKAIDKFNTEDYFELSSYKHLTEETKDYVPKYTALMIIHKNLMEYGFDYPDIQPIVYEKVKLDYPVNLYILSKLTGIELNNIMELNPSLRRWITPPSDTFELKIPVGYKDKVLAVLNSYSPEELLQVRIFTPAKKTRVVDIAKKFKTSPDRIMAMNGFKKPIVRAGFPVIIPSENGNVVIDTKKLENMTAISDKPEIETISYKVKKGDTFAKIANRYKTTAKAIQSHNRITKLKVGMDIEIPIKNSSKTASKSNIKQKTAKNTPTKQKFITYKVQKGDTIYKLASKYDTNPDLIIKLNNIKSLKQGQKIKIPKS